MSEQSDLSGERPLRSSGRRMQKYSKRQLILIRVGLAIGMPLLLLLVLEFALRLVTTGSLYFTERNPHYRGADGIARLVPNTRTWWYGNHYNINSNGFRMPHEVGPKSGLRILAIGDSVTLGMGVTQTRDVWPNRLETIAHERGQSKVEVINSAVQGWNLLIMDGTNLVPAEFVRFMSQDAPKFTPDVVVYCICLNDVPSDVTDLFVADNARNKARFKLFPESTREWFKRKAVYRLSRDFYRESRFRKLDFSGMLPPPQSEAFWARASEEIGRLKAATDAIHAKLYCVITPFSYQLLPSNYKLLETNRHWQQALDAHHIPWTDITGKMTEKNVLEFYSLGDYIHFNQKGHELIANEVYKLIEREFDARAH